MLIEIINSIPFSLGDIKLWKLLREKRKLRELAVTYVGCRPTCVNLLDCSQFPRNEVTPTPTNQTYSNEVTKNVALKSAENQKRELVNRGVVVIEQDETTAPTESPKNKLTKKDSKDECMSETNGRRKREQQQQQDKVTENKSKNKEQQNKKALTCTNSDSAEEEVTKENKPKAKKSLIAKSSNVRSSRLPLNMSKKEAVSKHRNDFKRKQKGKNKVVGGD